jgi:hypothetical protein
MSCADDGREHAVTDPAFVAGHQDSQGTYRAVCHHLVTPTSPAPTPRARCASCKHWLLDRARNEPEPHWMRWVHALINPVAEPNKPSAMTVGATWIRCLDKRDHVICEEAEVLGAGCLKALCDTRIYPLGVSDPRRCCRVCREAVRVASESPPRRIPVQRTRLRRE